MSGREDRKFDLVQRTIQFVEFDVTGRLQSDPTPCHECHAPLGLDECANERGEPSGVHAACWAAWCADNAARNEDDVVDAGRDAELFREWGGR